ncbi:MAG: 3-carboxy-cis,cis-muconate cycloisomerase [Alphaproteobacteria bacterium]|nr:3-carboxy-cis,cis-muconate cycloisomerase [Alphaproteobacteria bacterium]
MSASVFDHPLLGALLGDDELAAHFQIEAEIDAMLRFEIALADVEERFGVVSAGTGQALHLATRSFRPDLDALRQATRRDGLCVPEFIRQLRAATGKAHAADVHFGATSQDVIDTALVLRLKSVLDELEKRLGHLVTAFEQLDDRFGNHALMGQTRMQQALPIRCADRIAAWRGPVQSVLGALPELRRRVLRLQFGGPVGTLHQLGDKGPDISAALADALELADGGCWHTDRAPLAEYADWLSRITGALGKVGQDIALMAQNDTGMVRLTGGGGSSAMPHKQNPIAAETLVAIARFNATLISGMHQALVHENERSGSAWTLEWMVLPQMTIATGSALRLAQDLTVSIEEMGE